MADLSTLLDSLSAAVGGEAAGIGQGMDRLRRTLDVNVTAACTVIREAIETMMLKGHTDDTVNHKGHIVLINRWGERHWDGLKNYI